MRDLLVSQVVETTVVEQKQILERGREQIGIQRLDAPQGKAAQFAPARSESTSLNTIRIGTRLKRLRASDGVARAGTAGQQRNYIQSEQSHRFKITWELRGNPTLGITH